MSIVPAEPEKVNDVRATRRVCRHLEKGKRKLVKPLGAFADYLFFWFADFSSFD